MDAPPPAFDDNFDRLFKVALWAAHGADDPEGAAGEAMLQLYVHAKRHHAAEAWLASPSAIGWLRAVVRSRCVDGYRTTKRRDKAGRDAFRLGRNETSTGELLEAEVLGTMVPRHQRPSFTSEALRAGADARDHRDYECPFCLEREQLCPDQEVLANIAGSFIESATHALNGTGPVDAVHFEKEPTLRATAVAIGVATPEVLDASKGQAAHWFRLYGRNPGAGVGVHAAFATYRASVRLGPVGHGSRKIVVATVRHARSRLRDRWTPNMEKTMNDWCDDIGEDWPEAA